MVVEPLGILLLPVAAGFELIADKTPWIGSRLAPGQLLGRVASSVLSVLAVAPRGSRRPVLRAALGAGAAIASAFTLYRLRKFATSRLGVPNVVAGLAEDAAMLTLAAATVR